MPAPIRYRREHRHRFASWTLPVTIRLATDGDGPDLERLAQLDSRRVPSGPHLVAEREGRIDAALSLTTQEVVADPFQRTAETCEVLRCYAGRLRTARVHRPAALMRPRPVTVSA